MRRMRKEVHDTLMKGDLPSSTKSSLGKCSEPHPRGGFSGSTHLRRPRDVGWERFRKLSEKAHKREGGETCGI